MNGEKAIVKFDPTSGFEFTDLDGMFRVAECFIQSRLAPPSFDTPQKLIIAWASAAEIGIKPFVAMRGMSVVNGRMGMMTDLELAKVRTSGQLLETPKTTYKGEGETRSCTVTLHRKGDPEPRSYSYSIKEARAAKLMGSDAWNKYPDRMLYHRAIGFGLNDMFTDILYGMPTTEALQDYPPLEAPAYQEEAKVAASQARDYQLKREGVKFVPGSGKQPTPKEALEPAFEEDRAKPPAQEPRTAKPAFSEKLAKDYPLEDTGAAEEALRKDQPPLKVRVEPFPEGFQEDLDEAAQEAGLPEEEPDDIDMTPVPPEAAAQEEPPSPAKPEWMDHLIRSVNHPRFLGKKIADLPPEDLRKIETQWIPKVQADMANASADQKLELKYFHAAIAHRNATTPV